MINDLVFVFFFILHLHLHLRKFLLGIWIWNEHTQLRSRSRFRFRRNCILMQWCKLQIMSCAHVYALFVWALSKISLFYSNKSYQNENFIFTNTRAEPNVSLNILLVIPPLINSPILCLYTFHIEINEQREEMLICWSWMKNEAKCGKQKLPLLSVVSNDNFEGDLQIFILWFHL